MASANTGKPPVTISVPDLPSFEAWFGEGGVPQAAAASQSFTHVVSDDPGRNSAEPGYALLNRIIGQAAQQQGNAASAVLVSPERQIAAADAKAARQAAAEASEKLKEAARVAALVKAYILPTSSYTITSTFGQAGSIWSAGFHTGLDFAAPTGTLIKAIHGGKITEAGWSGSYGYRTILSLEDGTQLWFCHQSSMSVSVGQKVATGAIIGRVGATGNVTGAHLHLEVHPNGESQAVDPMAWLRERGLRP